MKNNIGKLDRIIRILLAFTTFYLYYVKSITGTFLIMATAMLLFTTGIVGNCPLYSLFGIRTRR
ncbi:Protein of unknown function [Chitinophaga sp. CF118]|uniref:YgaP family membrane protein n=1 Tax=Chitinophaga sp. CF118 TaxID=1884367 RepID=UPI0008E8BF69|nr:DUF2892 domain-containing protein [Chitinophaga sp. CF118]SFD79906.1 Protein of unknown function [Chitinophaga sp. CF118]